MDGKTVVPVPLLKVRKYKTYRDQLKYARCNSVLHRAEREYRITSLLVTCQTEILRS